MKQPPAPRPEPPQWAERLLMRIAAPHLREELAGDLYELFQHRLQHYGLRNARLLYVLELLLLLHPRLWRRQPDTATRYSVHLQHSSPHPATMFSNYLKIARRKLIRQKTYTAVNIISLSLGIACAILIFTLISYHLSFDAFHASGNRIYRIYTELHQEQVKHNTGVPYPLGEAFRTETDVAEKTGRAVFLTRRLITISPDKKSEEDIAFADPEFLELFNFPLLQGNPKTALHEPYTALITERLARQYFGTGEAVGKLLRIDQSLVVTVTGVLRDLPPNTDFRTEIYLPFSNLQAHIPWMAEKDWWLGFNKEMQCFVRLKPGVEAADVEAGALRAISAKHYDKANAGIFHFKLQPLSDIHFNPKLRGQTERQHLWTFGLTGLFLVITACVNFINLATAQALGRSREVGVRKALGSQRGSLFWQFMTETGLIAGIGMVLALGLAYAAIPFVNQWFGLALSISPATNPYLPGFLILLWGIVVFFSGAYPGLILARFQPVQALKGKLLQGASGSFSLRKGLVVAQFAISQLLIIGTLVITSQLRYSQQTSMGFRKDALVIVPLPDNQPAIRNTLANRLSGLSGVENVTFFDTPPATESVGSTIIRFASRPDPEKFNVSIKATDHRYLPTFAIPILAGRNLTPSDTAREYLLNETAVKALGLVSARDAIGKPASVDNRPGTIVGVVKDFHFKSFRTAIEPLCMSTRSEAYTSCGIKVSPRALATTMADIEQIWKAQYPASIFTYRFMDEDVARFYKLDRMLLQLIQLFAGIALFVGCLGLYGLVSFMAAQKTKEIGVRKVLGATTGNILWLFGKEFTRLLLIAFMLAAPLAWWLMHKWLANFVYRIDPGSGLFILAIVITLLVALLTVGFRSLKAALTNPVKSLRSE